MELDLNEFGKNYVTFKNYVFYGVILIGIIYIAVLFLGDDESIGVSFLAIQFLSSICLLLLPVSIILAFIKKTRKLGGAFLYFVAVIFLVYWWIAGLTLIHQKSGFIWSLVGIGLSLVTMGFGMFLVVVISAILHKAWSAVLIFIGFPLLSKIVMNVGVWLMEITPEQVKEKIVKFEEEQDSEIKEIEEKLNKKELELAQMDKEFENDFEDEDEDDWDEYYDNLSEEELRKELEKSEKELEDLEEQIRETQIEEAESRGELVNMMFNDSNVADFVNETYEQMDLEEGTFEKYSRDALVEWKKGNRKKSLNLYNKAIEINPDDAIDLMNRGNLKIELGLFDEGIEDLETARNINPTLPTDNAIIFKSLFSEMREVIRQKMLNNDN